MHTPSLGQRRRFLDDFLDLEVPEDDLADEDEPAFAGILSVSPALKRSLVIPLAFFISAMLTPYFLEMLLRVSPDLSL